MTALSHPSAHITSPARAWGRADCQVRLRLLPTGDGWSLVAPDGKVVFHALGLAGRRRCLEAARADGVLAIL